MPSSTLSPDEKFHLQLGFCITTWAAIEDLLFTICLKILNTTDQRASIVYYRIPTLDTRLKLIDELALSALPKRERKSGGHDHPDVILWAKMRKRIENQLGTRRRIAHHPVLPMTAMKVRVTKDMMGELVKRLEIRHIETTTWFEIYASEAERLRGRDADTSPLKIDDLKNHCMQVRALVDQLDDFISKTLAKHLKSPPEPSPEPD